MPYRYRAYKNVLRQTSLKFAKLSKALQRKALKNGKQLLRKVVICGYASAVSRFTFLNIEMSVSQLFLLSKADSSGQSDTWLQVSLHDTWQRSKIILKHYQLKSSKKTYQSSASLSCFSSCLGYPFSLEIQHLNICTVLNIIYQEKQ